ncbi:MAG TPA: isocitrate lyase/phosphoenolpyruvate mutase family protein [Acidimicrobiales bacterium]|nr:isocitrate lyase/phosphoenolpyruvate mutase family protein [Acidimicrobiales bacterium]
MTDTTKAERFLALHHGDSPLLLANAWDAGSARLLESLGYKALATTSSGFAATLGRLDYAVTQEEALAHGAAIAGAVDVPVSADLENCFADDPAGVAETVRLAIDAGLAGGSIEDFTRRPDDPIYAAGEAAERVAAAVEAAQPGDEGLRYVLTARAENYLHGRPDLADTIARLQSFQEAGADVLYAPGVSAPDDVRELVRSVDRPVNVLALPGGPTVAELAELGVARVSVGGAFAYAAYGALVAAAKELQDQGTYEFWTTAGVGGQAARAAFRP